MQWYSDFYAVMQKHMTNFWRNKGKAVKTVNLSIISILIYGINITRDLTMYLSVHITIKVLGTCRAYYEQTSANNRTTKDAA